MISLAISSNEMIFNTIEDLGAAALLIGVPLFLLMATPIIIAFLIYKRKTNETNKRSQVLLSAIEKNNGTLPTELLKSLEHSGKQVKQRLLASLKWGVAFSCIGLSILVLAAISGGDGLVIGLILLSVGIGFLVYYFAGRRMLKPEIEAEERSN